MSKHSERAATASADAITRSKYYATLHDPRLNEHLWQYLTRDVQATNAVIAASPRLQQALAGRTLLDLYREGALGEYFGAELLHALDHPEEYGARDRREVERFLNVDTAWVDELATLRDGKDLAARMAERDAQEGRKTATEREASRVDETVDKYLDPETDRPTKFASIATATQRHDYSAGAAVRDLRRLSDAFEDGQISAAQFQQAHARIMQTRGIETALERESIRDALRNGAIDLTTAQQYDRAVDLRAMVRGDLRPFTGTPGEWKTALAEQQVVDREAAERGELAPPKEHYVAEPDGITPAGLTPEQQRAFLRAMPSRVEGFTAAEEVAFRGDRRAALDAVYATRALQGDVDRELAVQAEERDERDERFAKGEATGRDHLERAWDEAHGTGREGAAVPMDHYFESEIARYDREAGIRPEPTPPPPEEPRAVNETPTGLTTREALEHVYDQLNPNDHE